jgi:hypothetical protein
MGVTLVLPSLTVAKPEPKFIVKEPIDFEFPFYGHELIAGLSADRSSLTTQDRVKLATPLALFLKALHATLIFYILDNINGDESQLREIVIFFYTPMLLV